MRPQLTDALITTPSGALSLKVDNSGYGDDLSLASQSIPSWNQITAWFKEMETLREGMS